MQMELKSGAVCEVAFEGMILSNNPPSLNPRPQSFLPSGSRRHGTEKNSPNYGTRNPYESIRHPEHMHEAIGL